jgi:hypothetical protein
LSGTQASSLSDWPRRSGRRESNTRHWVGSPGSDHQTAPANRASRRCCPDLAGATSAGCPLGPRGVEPHAGVEPASTSLPRTAATMAMRREWSCRESHPVVVRATHVVILMNNPAVELSGIAPERRPCRGQRRPFAQPRGAAGNRTRTPSLRTTKVTFHTTPHQRPESNLVPSFWRRRCALRPLVSAPRRGIEPPARVALAAA